MSLTKQDIFDSTARFIARQGKSVDGYGRCCYRGPDGKKCAAGLWIKDEFYDPEIEGEVIHQAICIAAAIESGVPDDCIRLLRALQRAHDGTYNGPNFGFDFLTECRDVAEKYGLSSAVIDDLLPAPPTPPTSAPTPSPSFEIA